VLLVRVQGAITGRSSPHAAARLSLATALVAILSKGCLSLLKYLFSGVPNVNKKGSHALVFISCVWTCSSIAGDEAVLCAVFLRCSWLQLGPVARLFPVAAQSVECSFLAGWLVGRTSSSLNQSSIIVKLCF